VFSILDNNLKKSISEYLELCFVNRTASPGMLNDANPVKEFEYVRVVDGAVIHSMIRTGISIIRNKEKEIEKIMFIFDDITAEYELKKELQERDREYGKRYSIMVSLFSNDKSVVRNFIQGLEEDTRSLSARIKEIKQNEKNSALIMDLLGIVHSIKGEAFALGFKELAETAGEFESFFKRIKDEVIGLENNLEIISFFERLNNEKKEFDKTISVLQEFISDDENEVQSVQKDSSALDLSVSKEKHLKHENISFNLLRKELELITGRAAEELSKECRFELDTDLAGIDGKRYKVLKEIFLHMVRNSLAHGIESPEERLAAGKSRSGSISLDIRKEEGRITFNYSDDGRGFDIGKIRNKALEEGLINGEASAGMTEKDVLRLVFSDGFSTSDTGDMVSGTGVGMSVIRKNVFRGLQGKLSLTNRPGEGVRVRITVPDERRTA
jgi:chemotaxis protein histidine kinase CheA